MKDDVLERAREVLADAERASKDAERVLERAREGFEKARAHERGIRLNELLAILVGPRGADLIEALVPEHSLQTCSDVKPGNTSRCPRCVFLFARERGFWYKDVVINVTIQETNP